MTNPFEEGWVVTGSGKVFVTVLNESKDAIQILRDMLRQAERGDVALTKLSITRLQSEDRFTIAMEMYVRDRDERSQPAPAPVVNIDPKMLQVTMYEAPRLYVVLQARNTYDHQIPAEPYSNLLDRILREREKAAYSVIRVPYEVYGRLIGMGLIAPSTASPAVLFGLDLIVEPPGSATPVFEDNEPVFEDNEAEWVGITNEGYLNRERRPGEFMKTLTLDELKIQDRKRQEQFRKFRNSGLPKLPPEPVKPKTPAGASAAREIIFDD